MMNRVVLADGLLAVVALAIWLGGTAAGNEIARSAGALLLAATILIAVLVAIRSLEKVRRDAALIRKRTHKLAEDVAALAQRAQRIEQRVDHGPLSRLPDRLTQLEYMVAQQMNHLESLENNVVDLGENLGAQATDNRTLHEMTLAHIIELDRPAETEGDNTSRSTPERRTDRHGSR